MSGGIQLQPTPLDGSHVVLGVAGSIAAYKAAYVASSLRQLGARVSAILTTSAQRFVGSATFAALTGESVTTSLWDQRQTMAIDHVALGVSADCILVAPATANTIAKLALGITDDALTATALASGAPLVLAPAMDGDMFASPATQRNLETLAHSRNATIVGPDAGRLASGLVGEGRLAHPHRIVDVVRSVVGKARGDYGGRKVVVTAGGTVEPIDPVRVITNRSTGKMGYAVAAAARDRGADVVLVAAPTALPKPHAMQTVAVETVEQMRNATMEASAGADLLVMSAAISDFAPASHADEKIKKAGNENLSLELAPIADWMPDVRGERLVKVAFAAETGDAAAKAAAKVRAKDAAFTVANDVSEPGSGFGTETNRVDIVRDDGSVEPLPMMSKYDVGTAILDRALPLLARLE